MEERTGEVNETVNEPRALQPGPGTEGRGVCAPARGIDQTKAGESKAAKAERGERGYFGGLPTGSTTFVNSAGSASTTSSVFSTLFAAVPRVLAPSALMCSRSLDGLRFPHSRFPTSLSYEEASDSVVCCLQRIAQGSLGPRRLVIDHCPVFLLLGHYVLQN
jgi:hypothetical protein